jgi:tRNA-binding EMAP/Myf-like protein
MAELMIDINEKKLRTIVIGIFLHYAPSGAACRRIEVEGE